MSRLATPLIALTLLLAGCGGSSEPEAGDTPAPDPSTPTSPAESPTAPSSTSAPAAPSARPQVIGTVARNLEAMAPGGRHVSLSFLQGPKIELDLQLLMRKSLSLTSSTLRPKSREEKARLASCIREHLLPWLASGAVRPVIHAQLPLSQAAEAHRLLEANANLGKVLLTVAAL